MNTEQKAKAYDKAVKEASIAYKDEDKHLKATLERIFPELKESEDERIRKAIMEFFELQDDNTTYSFIPKKDILVWLEKQGTSNPKSALEAWKAMRFEVYQQASGNRHGPNCSDDTTKMFSINDIDEIFEKICEQNPTDKVEPKFYEGEWVVTSYGKVNQVIAVDEDGDGFTLDDYTYFGGSWCDKYHLWTIQDAKDGDVLVASDGSIFLFAGVVDCACKYYAVLTTFNEVKIKKEVYDSGYWETSRAVHPSTKEQRDALFTKIKEAGYEWDADKKELKIVDWSKHIKYNPNATSITEEKSDWNEKDEKIRQTIINEFEQCSEWYCSNGLTKEDCINWLNKQEHFKCADEDNEKINSLCVLLDQLVSINVIGNEHSIEYKNWLKSLKERIGG